LFKVTFSVVETDKTEEGEVQAKKITPKGFDFDFNVDQIKFAGDGAEKVLEGDANFKNYIKD
jgi:hypothetical protein